MTIRIDLEDARPLEDQIAISIRQALAQGGVTPGAELPSVRQLAADLGVHWNTVARAYRRLADEGLISVRRGRGAVASDRLRTFDRVTRTGLRDRFSEAMAAAILGGLNRKDISEAFREALAGFGDRIKG
jgi:DNA-binding transcriptional regulator YhcF (GntR family)